MASQMRENLSDILYYLIELVVAYWSKSIDSCVGLFKFHFFLFVFSLSPTDAWKTINHVERNREISQKKTQKTNPLV
jgi:hypothetical protein